MKCFLHCLLLGAVLAVAEAGKGGKGVGSSKIAAAPGAGGGASKKRVEPPSGTPFRDGDVLTTVVSGITYNDKKFTYPAEPKSQKVGVPKGYINFNMLMVAAEMSDRIAQWTPKMKFSVAAERHMLPVRLLWVTWQQ